MIATYDKVVQGQVGTFVLESHFCFVAPLLFRHAGVSNVLSMN